MPEDYLKKEFWKLLKALPEELRETVLAPTTNESIWRVCEENNLDVDIAKFNRLVSDVLMGVLSPEEFQGVLETELGLESKTAKKVAFQINRYIFRPVKESLKLLYEEEKPEKEKMPEKEEKKPQKRDIYREPIE